MADGSALNLYLIAFLLAAGIAAHFLKKLYDLEQAGTILPPFAFVRQRPYASLSAVFGAYLLAALCYFTGQLTYSTAILIGVTCGSAFDSLRARAAGQLAKMEKAE